MESQQKTILVVAGAALALSAAFACFGGAALLLVVSRPVQPAPAGGPAPPAPLPANGTGAQPIAPPQEKTAGHFKGRVSGPGGGPIRIKDAQIVISISGVTKRGENVSFHPAVSADGTFDLELIEGIYHAATADVRVPRDGKTFRFALHPVPYDTRDHRSDEGIVQDFEWRLTGVRAGQDADPRNHTRWYGGSIKMGCEFWRNDINKPMPKPPAGTKVTFTLVPTGPLIDGSTGKTLTFERDWDSSFQGLDNQNLPDIPVGTYVLTGFETLPDGTRRPLLLQKAYKEFVDSLEVKFGPGDYGEVWVPIIGFTRPE